MTVNRSAGDDVVWAQVEREKRTDRLVRRMTIAAWAATLVLVVVFVVLAGLQVAEVVQARRLFPLPWSVVGPAAFPLLVVLGLLSVLIATLGTIAVFLRLRTASLLEIQLRLAALEEMLTSRGDETPADRPHR